MPKPKHEELTSIRNSDGRRRFCLDRVDRSDRAAAGGKGALIEYAFVWRGNASGPNGFNIQPAYFTWDLIAKLLSQAKESGHISQADRDNLVRVLVQG